MSRPLESIFTKSTDLVRGASSIVTLKSVTTTDVRVKADICKSKNRGGAKGTAHKISYCVGAISTVTLAYSAGYETTLKIAHVGRVKDDTKSKPSNYLSIADIINKADLVPDFFNRELGDDLVERYAIHITKETFRARLSGLEDILCEYWDDTSEKTIHVDSDSDVEAILNEHQLAFAPKKDAKHRHFKAALIKQIDKAIRESAIKFLTK